MRELKCFLLYCIVLYNTVLYCTGIVLYCIVCILGTIVSPTNRLNRQDPVWDADSPAPSNLELDGCSKANPPTGWSTLGGHLLNILNNGRVQ